MGIKWEHLKLPSKAKMQSGQITILKNDKIYILNFSSNFWAN